MFSSTHQSHFLFLHCSIQLHPCIDTRGMSSSTFTIRRDPTLFLETRKYHSRTMKQMFLKHYQPRPSGMKLNKKWTRNMSVSDMFDLRIHLTWVLGMKVFNWSNNKIGRAVLRVYSRTGELTFLINVVRNNM